MAISKGSCTLLEALEDCDITGGGTLGNARMLERALKNAPFGLLDVAGTVTGHHRNIDGTWGTVPHNRKKIFKDVYLDPRTKNVVNVSDTGFQTKVENARNSVNDCGVEGRICGQAAAGMNLIFEGKIKGFGSNNNSFAPSDIDVIGWQSGYFNGSLSILSSVAYYGTFSDRPFSQEFTVPSNRTYLTIIMRQYCFGPNHQPPGSGEAPIGTVYHTLFDSIRVRRK